MHARMHGADPCLRRRRDLDTIKRLGIELLAVHTSQRECLGALLELD